MRGGRDLKAMKPFIESSGLQVILTVERDVTFTAEQVPEKVQPTEAKMNEWRGSVVLQFCLPENDLDLLTCPGMTYLGCSSIYLVALLPTNLNQSCLLMYMYIIEIEGGET